MTGQSAISEQHNGLPYRGVFGDRRPSALAGLCLPPSPMPARRGLRPLKAWRYVGVYGPEIMLCLASVRVGPARQAFWAVWDRTRRRLQERTGLGRGGIVLESGRARVDDGGLLLDLELEETPGVETICAAGDSYAWTRKQGGIRAWGRVRIGELRAEVDAHAVLDDTFAYYPRHTAWRWCAGVGSLRDGRSAAWSLVAGVNDPPRSSERTVWIDGRPAEAPAVAFAADLSAVGGLRFHAEAVRARRENLLLVRSRYRQPFGTFTGKLPGGLELAAGFGVMEEHDARW